MATMIGFVSGLFCGWFLRKWYRSGKDKIKNASGKQKP